MRCARLRGGRRSGRFPKDFVKRALDGDWDGVAELYHPAAIQMPPDQPAVEGREAIRRALSRTLGAEAGVTLKDFSVCIQEAEGIADLVYVRAAYRLNMSVIVDDEAHSVEQRGPYINILRLLDSRPPRLHKIGLHRKRDPPVVCERLQGRFEIGHHRVHPVFRQFAQRAGQG
jgi:ketosteroid isomerase-like protein